MLPSIGRRPLRTRERRWAIAMARGLAGIGVRPNPVSIASVVFAALGAAALVASSSASPRARALLLVAAAAAIQLRLLCNMLDGMLAVEGGFHGKLGDLYNEVPDRIADSLFLIGAGYSLSGSGSFGPVLGWASALLAIGTAYVRVLGGSLGLAQSFLGPMAKQHRMFVLTLGCCGGAIESALGRTPPRSLEAALVVIAVGSAATAVRRLARIARELAAR